MDEREIHRGIEEVKERLTKVETTVELTREEMHRDLALHKQEFTAHEMKDDHRFDQLSQKLDNARMFIAKLVGVLTVLAILAPLAFKALGWIQ